LFSWGARFNLWLATSNRQKEKFQFIFSTTPVVSDEVNLWPILVQNCDDWWFIIEHELDMRQFLVQIVTVDAATVIEMMPILVFSGTHRFVPQFVYKQHLNYYT
jgi:hypothetical protein